MKQINEKSVVQQDESIEELRKIRKMLSAQIKSYRDVQKINALGK